MKEILNSVITMGVIVLQHDDIFRFKDNDLYDFHIIIHR